MKMLKTRAYLYRWTEVSTGKIYVGSRTKKGCHPDDGYLCSSKIVKPMILSNPENWKREILCIGDPIYIRELESKYLVSVDAAKNEQYYNQHNSDGKFTNAGIPQTQKQRDAISKANKGRQKTPAQLEASRKNGLASKGRPQTPTQKAAARQTGLASKGFITTFNLVTHEIKHIPKEEFEAGKGTLYVGNRHHLAKAWKESQKAPI